MKAHYHSVETFGTVDGKGIRYVLFLTGCALGCRFCHNPDTWRQGGKTITVAGVLAEYQKYRPYYEASGGGLTVSGGEPLLQAGFVAELFAACRREGISTTLDTAGYAGRSAFDQVLPYTDAVLYGLKGATDRTYRRLTQAGSRPIIDNLRHASSSGVPVTVRYILIPAVNDSEQELLALAGIIHSLPQPAALEILPYHTMGVKKWAGLGLEYSLSGIRPASDQDVNQAKEFLARQGIAAV